MKILHLLRHAKSSWTQPHLSDRERGLKKRGMRDAPRMGAALAQRVTPMSVHVSPARRAQMTLQALCVGWPALADFAHHTDESLYTYSGKDLFRWIAQQRDKEQTLFIIAHNPALTDLINTLMGRHALDNLPTAGYVELDLPIDHWRDLPHCHAVLQYSLFPRQLGSA